MTLPDPILATAPVAGIVHPHQSTVDAIQRAAREGLFTELEAEQMIGRVRAHVSMFTLPAVENTVS